MNIGAKNSNHRAAFTRIELIVVVATIFAFISLLLLANDLGVKKNTRQKVFRIVCVNNLKQIGTAYRIWAGDHADQYPPEAASTNNGWSGLLERGNAGAFCWTNYVVMSNELGAFWTHVLVCPADERKPSADDAQITNNLALSYFVGTGADAMHPEAILGGDRNLAPGVVPQNDYGYSPANGQGNDVIIANAVCWSLKMHTAAYGVGAGNIILGDGSEQQTTSAGLRQNWLKPLLEATNHVPVRLIFP